MWQPPGSEYVSWSTRYNPTMSPPSPVPTAAAHARVNGIEMYYEIHGGGGGPSLVLLHGGGSTIEVSWSRILPFLARHRRVIALEEQGHGRTSDRDAPVRFDTSADDVAGLLDHLDMARADLLGFSNGASVALQVAIRHPTRVRKLVFASSFTNRAGAHNQLWEFMARADFSSMPQPLKDAFLKVNPDQAKLKVMHDKDAARMRNFPDVADDDLRGLQASTLVLAGDRDVVRLEHLLELTRLVPQSRLAILPAGHGDYLGEAVASQGESSYPELTAGLIEQFLVA